MEASGAGADNRRMVRTGRRASILAELLMAAGLTADPPPGRPSVEELPGPVMDDLFVLYQSLGGVLDRPALRPGAWDLKIGGVRIELDEELHFNRYRATTLRRAWAVALPWTASYLDMCGQHEPECLRAGRWGQRWTSEPSARMFGGGARPGDIYSDAGAPRWKQRALYDAVKDAIAAHTDVKVARLSVHDLVSGRRLGDALEGRATVDLRELLALVESRTA